MPRTRLGARNIRNKFGLQLGERAEDHQGNLARSSQVDTQSHAHDEAAGCSSQIFTLG